MLISAPPPATRMGLVTFIPVAVPSEDLSGTHIYGVNLSWHHRSWGTGGQAISLLLELSGTMNRRVLAPREGTLMLKTGYPGPANQIT